MRALTAFFARLAAMRRVARQRRELARLSPELLRDIGLHPGDAASEARRRFWDLPDAAQSPAARRSSRQSGSMIGLPNR